jgi:hypothetical protein
MIPAAANFQPLSLKLNLPFFIIIMPVIAIVNKAIPKTSE